MGFLFFSFSPCQATPPFGDALSTGSMQMMYFLPLPSNLFHSTPKQRWKVDTEKVFQWKYSVFPFIYLINDDLGFFQCQTEISVSVKCNNFYMLYVCLWTFQRTQPWRFCLILRFDQWLNFIAIFAFNIHFQNRWMYCMYFCYHGSNVVRYWLLPLRLMVHILKFFNGITVENVYTVSTLLLFTATVYVL